MDLNTLAQAFIDQFRSAHEGPDWRQKEQAAADAHLQQVQARKLGDMQLQTGDVALQGAKGQLEDTEQTRAAEVVQARAAFPGVADREAVRLFRAKLADQERSLKTRSTEAKIGEDTAHAGEMTANAGWLGKEADVRMSEEQGRNARSNADVGVRARGVAREEGQLKLNQETFNAGADLRTARLASVRAETEKLNSELLTGGVKLAPLKPEMVTAQATDRVSQAHPGVPEEQLPQAEITKAAADIVASYRAAANLPSRPAAAPATTQTATPSSGPSGGAISGAAPGAPNPAAPPAAAAKDPAIIKSLVNRAAAGDQQAKAQLQAQGCREAGPGKSGRPTWICP